MRNAGAAYMVLAWTAFWWIETYPEFVAYLRSHYSCKIDNERVIIFDLCRFGLTALHRLAIQRPVTLSRFDRLRSYTVTRSLFISCVDV